MRLTAKVAEELETIGVTVDSDMHQDLEKIMEEEEKTTCHQNSFQRLFWEQQLNDAWQCNANSMRWHPLMIRWCLYLRHQSQSAYETLDAFLSSRNVHCTTTLTTFQLQQASVLMLTSNSWMQVKSLSVRTMRNVSSCSWMKCVSGRIWLLIKLQVHLLAS